ncbi:MAG: hypothetical protein HC780_20475 [Leptolyngbyaceae cyanobacterium CSU_1_3]|nr:hypothetical protein [Leptolyngbyaceae cyanobacterium CSU_1_3]
MTWDFLRRRLFAGGSIVVLSVFLVVLREACFVESEVAPQHGVGMVKTGCGLSEVSNTSISCAEVLGGGRSQPPSSKIGVRFQSCIRRR